MRRGFTIMAECKALFPQIEIKRSLVNVELSFQYVTNLPLHLIKHV